MVIGREAVVDNDVTFVVDVAVMEEINGAFLRTAVLVVAPPAEEEQDDERDCKQTDYTAYHTTNNRTDVCGPGYRQR